MGYVDDAGRPVAVPAAESPRVAVPLLAGGTEVGVLVRDERLETDPVLASGVAQAAELALANVRLNAATQRQLEELQASRVRLIAAGESERSRIRRELGSGALRRLAAVEERLARDRDDAPGRHLLAEARSVIDQLNAFALGLGSDRLLEPGLAEALRRVGERSPVPVTVDVPAGRWPAVVESTVYFVAAEALTNVAKHAAASRVRLRVEEVDGALRLEIEDDGVGGAARSAGSGLDGLVQRVEATGGWLRIEERDGGGTRLTAELPIDRVASLDALPASIPP
jgi:signal transduction histidine kinase